MTLPARQRRGVVALVALAMLAALPAGAPAGEPGAVVPDVEMRDGKGRRLRLSDFKGQVVLVDLWASWCGPCQVSFPALDALYREYRSRGVEVIAVNLDERRREADRFLEARPHEMRVVFDPRARVLKAFGAPGVPSAYLIDREGTIRYAHEGYTATTPAQLRHQLEILLAEPHP